MKVTSIAVTRTRQVRQYEPLTLSATADVDPNQTAAAAFRELHHVVQGALVAAIAASTAPAAVRPASTPAGQSAVEW